MILVAAAKAKKTITKASTKSVFHPPKAPQNAWQIFAAEFIAVSYHHPRTPRSALVHWAQPTQLATLRALINLASHSLTTHSSFP